jgi:hypothetical protein
VTLYLRQLVLAVADLDRVLDDACAIFATKMLHSDPEVGEFGVRNAVFALGTQYIELLAPLTHTAPVARFLARHGEGLYAVMLQCEDDRPYRSTAQTLGIRAILDLERGDYRCCQLHPVDAGLPVILEIDQQPGGPSGPYYPAGNGIPEQGSSGRSRIDAICLAVPDPEVVAGRWRRLLNLATAPEAAVPLGNAAIRFATGAGAEVMAAVTDPVGVLEAAIDRRHALDASAFRLAGVRFRISEV